MSLYQKYRPKNFGDALTQTHVKDILQTSVKNGSFGHAYLFVGTRGTGKTSLARIFARTLNCENREFVAEHGEPCNECNSCLLSLNGSHTDIIEMDAASNRGIEEVRGLKEAVDFMPSIGTHKVYIIDEAHMMTREAFNALLKTIEEPPKHIVFIMCTTELFKVPATIISRSQVFELKNASIDEIVSKIDRILANEAVEIDLEGKRLIAKLGKGSFRDMESILEKVINSAKVSPITHTDVISALGLSSVMLIDSIKNLLYTKDLAVLQKTLQSELDEGSISTFNNQLTESVYEDITEGLLQSQIDPFRHELFDFLASVDKDLRNTTNPKLLYIAKLLNNIKNYHGQSFVSQMSAVQINVTPSAVEATPKVVEEVVPVDPEKAKKNPSELLRQRMMKQSTSIQDSPTAQEAVQQPKFVSKIDFLNYMQEKNSFLFRFFSTHEFSIESDRILIDAKQQMEKDLLLRPQTIELINTFAKQHDMSLRIEFGEPKIDMRKKEEKVVAEIQKTVADIGEDELNSIFKAK